MIVLLLMLLSVGFLASLLPFVFPGALVSVVGVALNHWLGELLAGTLNVSSDALLGASGGQPTLTLGGVLAVYAPPLAVLLFILRGR